MEYYFTVILFGYLCIAGQNNLIQATPSLRGSCAFPCFMQNRVYHRTDDYEVHTISEATRRTVNVNGSTYHEDCIERSGPFIMTRVENTDGNGWYFCSKYMLNDQNADILTVYRTNFKYYPEYPDLCEVCNSQVSRESFIMKAQNVDCAAVKKPAMGCDTPITCPVIDSTTQNQCSCEHETFDSGVCCQ